VYWPVVLILTMKKSKYGATDILHIDGGGGDLRERNIPVSLCPT
jgi:hypothetical protein